MNNRRFSRVNFKGKAHLDTGNQSLVTDVLDLSLKGALVTKPSNWPTDVASLLQLRIQLEDFPIELAMTVSVAHMSDSLIGLHCEKIDIDSVSHLRRLLELNLGDADLLSRELSELTEHQ